MKRPMRVYADTSVFGGTQDDIFEAGSNAFFQQVRKGQFQLVVSGLVEKELRGAPEAVRAVFEELLPAMEVVEESAAALMLQQAYLDAGVVTPNWAGDALHVAVASVSECAAIVSWNFQHIVNLRRISLQGVMP
ncbi:MAG: hypothetical protein NTZ09_14950 [Candidatus Hydrogenedentes bacterium]|nr:hypothetical protein [Candidatus Hydrogenedentota bacterium]